MKYLLIILSVFIFIISCRKHREEVNMRRLTGTWKRLSKITVYTETNPKDTVYWNYTRDIFHLFGEDGKYKEYSGGNSTKCFYIEGEYQKENSTVIITTENGAILSYPFKIEDDNELWLELKKDEWKTLYYKLIRN